MNGKHLLLTGRPASGKTETLIACVNMYSSTTLFLSEENITKSKKIKSRYFG